MDSTLPEFLSALELSRLDALEVAAASLSRLELLGYSSVVPPLMGRVSVADIITETDRRLAAGAADLLEEVDTRIAAADEAVLEEVDTRVEEALAAFTDRGTEDLRFPASGINPPGAAGSATRNTTTGCLDFAGNADNLVAGAAQMPHLWAAGTSVTPHIHLVFPTSAAANTRWKLEYNIGSINGDFVNNYGSYTDGGTITVANPQNVKKHVLAVFDAIDMTGHGASAMILWRLTRLASSDAADDDASAAALTEFDIHYQVEL